MFPAPVFGPRPSAARHQPPAVAVAGVASEPMALTSPSSAAAAVPPLHHGNKNASLGDRIKERLAKYRHKDETHTDSGHTSSAGRIQVVTSSPLLSPIGPVSASALTPVITSQSTPASATTSDTNTGSTNDSGIVRPSSSMATRSPVVTVVPNTPSPQSHSASILLLPPPSLTATTTTITTNTSSGTIAQLQHWSAATSTSANQQQRPMTPPTRTASPIPTQPNSGIIIKSLSLQSLTAGQAKIVNSQSITVGKLHVRIVEGRGLGVSSSSTKMRTHLSCEFERHCCRSASHIGVSPFYGFSFTVPVTDVTADLYVNVIEEHKLTKNHSVGALVIPLTSLTATDWNPHTRHFALDEWIELLPTNYDLGPNSMYYHRWPSNEHRITGAGMRKPQRWPIGQLHVKCELSLVHPLAVCYAINLPIQPAKPVKVTKKSKSKKNKDGLSNHEESNNESASVVCEVNVPVMSDSGVEIHEGAIERVQSAVSPVSETHHLSDTNLASPPPSSAAVLPPLPLPVSALQSVAATPAAEAPEFHGPTFKRNFRRLQRWYATPAHWLYYAHLCRHWHSPPLSLLALLVLYALCFHTCIHHIPLLVFLTLLLIGLASFHHRHDDHALIITFDTEAIPSEYLKEGAWNKLRRWRGVLGRTSHAIGMFASSIERVSHALNFTDPHLSLLIYTLLFLFCAALSLLFYYVRPGTLLFVIGMLAMLDGLLLALKRWEIETKTLEKIETTNRMIELLMKGNGSAMAVAALEGNSHSHSGTVSPIDSPTLPTNTISHSVSTGNVSVIVSDSKRGGFLASLKRRAVSRRNGGELSTALLKPPLSVSGNNSATLVTSRSLLTEDSLSSASSLRNRMRSGSFDSHIHRAGSGAMLRTSTDSGVQLSPPTLMPSVSINAALDLNDSMESIENELFTEPTVSEPISFYQSWLLALVDRAHHHLAKLSWLDTAGKSLLRQLLVYVRNIAMRAPDQIELAHRVISERAFHSHGLMGSGASHTHEIGRHQLYHPTINITSDSGKNSGRGVSGALANAYQRLNKRKHATEPKNESATMAAYLTPHWQASSAPASATGHSRQSNGESFNGSGDSARVRADSSESHLSNASVPALDRWDSSDDDDDLDEAGSDSDSDE